MSNESWFRPKTFGYGAGVPRNWKGWVHLVVLFGGILGVNYLIQHYLPRGDWSMAFIAGAVFFILPMVALAMYKTGED